MKKIKCTKCQNKMKLTGQGNVDHAEWRPHRAGPVHLRQRPHAWTKVRRTSHFRASYVCHYGHTLHLDGTSKRDALSRAPGGE
jgi:hypothetical protein